MLFNSAEFLIFCPLVVAAYYCLRHRGQNWLLLGASLIFYAWWEWRALGILLITILLDFRVAIELDRLRASGASARRRRAVLALSLVANLLMLGFFKYFNFFATSLHDLLGALGLAVPISTLEILLPLGISFYTFQSMSYTIDVYRGELAPTRSLPGFALFVSFFPHLLAGPIMRAADLLPQVLAPRSTTRQQVVDGLHLILWGYWKKVFVGDNLGLIVDQIFSRSSPDGFLTIVGAYAFAWQIYADFSGYTDIARGVAKLLGFELTVNFDRPYFASSPREFWRRWHISLSSWVRRYVYIPLGGNRTGLAQTARNLFASTLLAGLWHGAAWTFVLFGAYHGALVVGERVGGAWWSATGRAGWLGAWIPAWLRVVLTFHLVCFGFLLFRSASLAQFLELAASLLRPYREVDLALAAQVALFAGPLLLAECLQGLAARVYLLRFERLPLELRVACYSAIAYGLLFVPATPRSFIYFQF